MSFDARSLERLQQLGRTLPQRLPQPEAPAPAAAPAARRHRVETETDPEALFRELMQVSPDGSVPPHLMDRLRQAEASAAERRRQRPAQGPQPRTAGADSAAEGPQGALRRQKPRDGGSPRTPAPSGEHQELYVAFQQLLLEDDGD